MSKKRRRIKGDIETSKSGRPTERPGKLCEVCERKVPTKKVGGRFLCVNHRENYKRRKNER